MSILNLQKSNNNPKNILVDICIIGGGISGLLIAKRLSSSGINVTVLESGLITFDEETHRLNEIDDPSGKYTRALDGRYRSLGGSSTRWGGRMIPISANEMQSRPHLDLAGWPFPTEELQRYNSQIEQLFKTASGSYDELHDERTAGARTFPSFQQSLSPRWAKVPSFKNCNIATLMQGDLARQKGLDIWLGATVCDFELDRDNGQLKAVTARSLNGNSMKVAARRFIIAAGTIETTRLLLLLDRKSEGRAFSGCDALGRYFQDHLKADVAIIGAKAPRQRNRLFGYRFINSTRRDLHLELSHQAQIADRAASAFGYVAMDLAESPLGQLKRFAHSLQRRTLDTSAAWKLSRNAGMLVSTGYWRLLRHQLFVPDTVAMRLMACVEQLPDRANRIVLSDRQDAIGMPLARFEWHPRHADERTFRALTKATAKYWEQTGMDAQCPLTWSQDVLSGKSAVIDRAEACAHPSGSTRMGLDPRDSVVAPDLHCHAVPNVAVASAAVFPSAGSANPTFTIMRLALWLADYCVREPVRQRTARMESTPVLAAGIS